MRAAYPSSQVWQHNEGMWLLVESDLIDGLNRKAVFAAAIPYDARHTVQSWAFWRYDETPYHSWIGPRHTNFPYGSICAFHPGDGTWQGGQSLVTLLDLYSVWAVRHLHLELAGRWPGSQYARWPFERMIETLPDELCGCGSEEKLYSECCRPRDLQRNRVAEAMKYMAETQGARRDVPARVLEFVNARTAPPDVAGYVMQVSRFG